jgi:hypothetical protein
VFVMVSPGAAVVMTRSAELAGAPMLAWLVTL